MAIRPAIRPLTDKLSKLLDAFRKEHQDELELIGDINIVLRNDGAAMHWDKTRVYDDFLSPRSRYDYVDMDNLHEEATYADRAKS